jgi:hypothetical protein
MSQGISVLSVAPFCFAFSDRGESPERIEKAGDAGDLCVFFPRADNPLRTLARHVGQNMRQ